MSERILPQFERLPESARAATAIPEDAEVVNITDKFDEGGPIVISYTRRSERADEAREENRRNLQFAIDRAFGALEKRRSNHHEKEHYATGQ